MEEGRLHLLGGNRVYFTACFDDTSEALTLLGG